MRNIKLILAYDGTAYHGFQKQSGTGLPTIQEILENALAVITQERVCVYASGRTDAGVHSRGQVVNFNSNTKIPVERLPLALNSLLPPDIVVLQAQDVPPEFHARFCAKSKTYCYNIYNDRHMSPFWRMYAYHVPVPLDLEKMREGATLFLGTHDFYGFCAQGTAVKDFVRTIYTSRWEREGPILRYVVQGNGFLWNMVRIMTGTLLEIGKNKREPTEIDGLLLAKERALAGMTLPPHGLCLISVNYETQSSEIS